MVAPGRGFIVTAGTIQSSAMGRNLLQGQHQPEHDTEYKNGLPQEPSPHW